MPRRPDFFIVGAPRSGTTAMIAYLGRHPEIFVPRQDNLHFFGSDLPFAYRPTRSEAEYLEHFAGAGRARRAGESSVWYLYSRRAAAEIKAFNPSADIIIMLRNPVDMLDSLHSQRLLIGAEDIPDFAVALAAEERRARGLDLPNQIGMADAVLYRRIAWYADQVARYLSVFGRAHVHVILYDEFARDPAGAYAGTLRFLGVDPGFRPAFPVINANRRPWSLTLTRLLRRPPRFAQQAGSRLLGRAMLRRAVELVTALLSRETPRPPMEPALRQRLQAEFASEVTRLGTLIGRDLSGWSRDEA